MEDDTSEPSDKSENSSSPLLVRIQVVEPTEDEDVTRESSLNDELDNEVSPEFANVEIPQEEFYKRIQDVGCTKEELKVKRYRAMMIPAYGPKEKKTYYYDLASIAIDYSKAFKKEHELKRGWDKTPKNQTEMKTRIIERLLAMRKFSDTTKKYELEQNDVLKFLLNMWGQSTPNKVLHFNNRLRLFGIIMTIPRNRPYFERLAKGVVNKNVLDDDDFNLKNIYQRLTWDFSNDSIIVELPTNAVDVAGFDTLDPNDATRTRIHRDCEFIIFIYSILFTYRFGLTF